MLVEVTVDYLPHFGVRGSRKELPDGQARVLILLSKVREVEETSPRATRRVYQRRDLIAEPDPVEVVTPPTTVFVAPPKKKRGRPRKPAKASDE